MQRITIKDVKSKSGTGGKSGKWTLVIITAEDGAEFTSFDTALEKFGPGTIIEIEPEVITKDGKTKVNIKEWKLISVALPAGPAALLPGSPYKRDTEGIEFEYNLKARLQSTERASIEAQTVYNGVIEILNNWPNASGTVEELSKTHEEMAEELKELRALVLEALKWARKVLGASGAPVVKKESAPPAKKYEEAGGPTPVELPRFKDGPALVNYALKHGWKIERVKESLGISNPTEIKDVEAATKVLFGPYIKWAEAPDLPF